MSDVSLACIPVGPLEANCYIVGCKKTKKAAIIDPGDDAPQIEAYVSKEGLAPELLINTHGHFDHIGANKEMKEAYPGLKICIHAADAPMLPTALKNFSILQGTPYQSPEADVLLEDGVVLACGEIELEVVHTPGHSPGGICLVLSAGGQTVMLSGDTLFAGGVGRTDFPGGDGGLLLKSIRERVLSYPDDVIVLPGHGPQTTIGEERRSNPFIRY